MKCKVRLGVIIVNMDMNSCTSNTILEQSVVWGSGCFNGVATRASFCSGVSLRWRRLLLDCLCPASQESQALDI